MRSCDFLLIYEIKPRELDSVLLLKYELERRGYKVILVNLWEMYFKCRQIKAKVVIASSMLDDMLFEFVNNLAYRPLKIVNMQWEQVLTRYFLSLSKNIKTKNEKAKQGIHLSWGECNRDRLIELYGIDGSHTRIVGQLSMDYLRPGFRPFFKTRKEICDIYGLDENKEIVLFISSFSYISISENKLNDKRYKEIGYDVFFRDMKEISIKTQSIFFDWFDKVLKENKNKVLIYRPHPAEFDNESLKEFERNHSNFHIITDGSVKQWILVSDRIYTWFSTSIVECCFAKKHCTIIRPVEIPEDYDVEIYLGAKKVKTYEEFYESFTSDAFKADHFDPHTFPISPDTFSKFYYSDENKPRYIDYCDTFEEILKDDSLVIESQKNVPKKKYSYRERKKAFLLRLFSRCKTVDKLANKNAFIKSKVAGYLTDNGEMIAFIKKHAADKREMREIDKKLKGIILNGSRYGGYK